MIDKIITASKKLMSDAFINLGRKFFPLQQGELLGFRAGLGVHTLIKEDGDLIPGHGNTIFVEQGKDINTAKDALSWAKTLNMRRVDFGKEDEISEDKISLIAVMRKTDSEDVSYLSKKIIDIMPEGEDKSFDDLYGVTPSIGRTATEHYMGIPIKGESEEELLKNASDFLEKLDNFKIDDYTNRKILASNYEYITTAINEAHKRIESEQKTNIIPLSERRAQKKETNQRINLGAQKKETNQRITLGAQTKEPNQRLTLVAQTKEANQRLTLVTQTKEPNQRLNFRAQKNRENPFAKTSTTKEKHPYDSY